MKDAEEIVFTTGTTEGINLVSYAWGVPNLKAGDEIITVAAGFPTTVAPIIQNGFVPVFIDNDPVTLNARVDQLEAAYREKEDLIMVGAYQMQLASGELINVEIPPFSLDSPHTRRSLN